MKNSSLGLALLAGLLVAAPLSTSAQSVGRIRKSLDKATGGATSAPAKSGATSAQQTTAVNPQTAAAAQQSKAQAAVNDAAYAKRNKAAQAGVDERVVSFLKQRVEDGSADAAFDLAKRYEEGKGVAADPEESRRLYKLSAERGNEEAKTWLTDNPEPEKPPGPEKAEEAVKPEEPAKTVDPAKASETARTPAPVTLPEPAKAPVPAKADK